MGFPVCVDSKLTYPLAGEALLMKFSLEILVLWSLKHFRYISSCDHLIWVMHLSLWAEARTPGEEPCLMQAVIPSLLLWLVWCQGWPLRVLVPSAAFKALMRLNVKLSLRASSYTYHPPWALNFCVYFLKTEIFSYITTFTLCKFRKFKIHTMVFQIYWLYFNVLYGE